MANTRPVLSIESSDDNTSLKDESTLHDRSRSDSVGRDKEENGRPSATMRTDIEAANLEGEDDEALKVLKEAHEASQAPIEDDEISQVVRQADWRVLSIISLITGLQYGDKAAIGVAVLFGLVRDTQLFTPQGTFDTHRYSLVVMIFFVGYLMGAPLFGTVAQRFPTGRTCAVLVFIWGVVTILAPLCSSFEGLMAQRFFLGLTEGGVSPATLSILGMWYSKREQALRAPVVFSFQGFFGILLLVLAYGVVKGGPPQHAWKNVFYLLGAVTISFSAIVFFFLPDSPVTARHLTPRQRYVAVERLRTNQAGITSRKVKLSHFLEALKDLKVIVLVLATFCIASPSGAVTSFTPLVIARVYGANPNQTLLLLIPTALVGGVSNVVAGTISTRVKNSRTAVVIGATLVALIGTCLQWRLRLTDKAGLLAAIYIIVAYSGSLGAITGFAISNTAGATKKTAVGSLVYMTIAIANIVTPFMFKRSEQPRYHSAFRATAILQAVGVILVALYCALCVRENRKRDRAATSEKGDHAFSDLTDKENTAFRYVY